MGWSLMRGLYSGGVIRAIAGTLQFCNPGTGLPYSPYNAWRLYTLNLYPQNPQKYTATFSFLIFQGQTSEQTH
jgi:hypothetical protein